MIVVANLQPSGFLGAVAERVVDPAHRPVVWLAAIVLVAGCFSAFFVNHTRCLVLTPLVRENHAATTPQPGALPARRSDGRQYRERAPITGNLR